MYETIYNFIKNKGIRDEQKIIYNENNQMKREYSDNDDYNNKENKKENE